MFILSHCINPLSFSLSLSEQSQLGGKLLIFQNTLPSLGVGRLKLRGDDLRVYGTDKEHMLRIPEDQFYKQMAAELTKYQIAVNVYAFSDKYTDIASLGTCFWDLLLCFLLCGFRSSMFLLRATKFKADIRKFGDLLIILDSLLICYELQTCYTFLFLWWIIF